MFYFQELQLKSIYDLYLFKQNIIIDLNNISDNDKAIFQQNNLQDNISKIECSILLYNRTNISIDEIKVFDKSSNIISDNNILQVIETLLYKLEIISLSIDNIDNNLSYINQTLIKRSLV